MHNNLPPILYPRIPILLYHRIATSPRDYLTLDPDSFKLQMDYLYRSGFETISLYQLYLAYYRNVLLPQKPVIITFDDGLLNQYTEGLPVLRKYNFTATFFVPTQPVLQGEEDHMTWQQLAHLKQLGMSVEAHSITHPDLRNLSPEEQTREISGSKKTIEKYLATHVNFFAYPGGLYNILSLVVTRRAGYLGAVTGQPGKVEVGEDTFTLKRIPVDGDASFEAFKRSVNG